MRQWEEREEREKGRQGKERDGRGYLVWLVENRGGYTVAVMLQLHRGVL